MTNSLLYLSAFAAIQIFIPMAVLAAWLAATGESADSILMIINGSKQHAATASQLVLSSAICNIIILALFLWRRWAVLSPAYLRMRKWSIFFWSATAAIGTILPSVWLSELLPPLPDTSGKMLMSIVNHEYGYFVLGLLAPFVEETVFRGAILKSLLSCMRSHWAAILISAVIFAVIHVNPAQMPHALLMGILFGWLYYRTGSILPGVAIHWINNTVTFVFCRLLPSMHDTTLTEFFNGDQKRVALSVIFSLFILIPSIYQISIRTSGNRQKKNQQQQAV